MNKKEGKPGPLSFDILGSKKTEDSKPSRLDFKDVVKFDDGDFTSHQEDIQRNIKEAQTQLKEQERRRALVDPVYGGRERDDAEKLDTEIRQTQDTLIGFEALSGMTNTLEMVMKGAEKIKIDNESLKINLTSLKENLESKDERLDVLLGVELTGVESHDITSLIKELEDNIEKNERNIKQMELRVKPVFLITEIFKGGEITQDDKFTLTQLTQANPSLTEGNSLTAQILESFTHESENQKKKDSELLLSLLEEDHSELEEDIIKILNMHIRSLQISLQRYPGVDVTKLESLKKAMERTDRPSTIEDNLGDLNLNEGEEPGTIEDNLGDLNLNEGEEPGTIEDNLDDDETIVNLEPLTTAEIIDRVNDLVMVIESLGMNPDRQNELDTLVAQRIRLEEENADNDEWEEEDDLVAAFTNLEFALEELENPAPTLPPELPDEEETEEKKAERHNLIEIARSAPRRIFIFARRMWRGASLSAEKRAILRKDPDGTMREAQRVKKTESIDKIIEFVAAIAEDASIDPEVLEKFNRIDDRLGALKVDLDEQEYLSDEKKNEISAEYDRLRDAKDAITHPDIEAEEVDVPESTNSIYFGNRLSGIDELIRDYGYTLASDRDDDYVVMKELNTKFRGIPIVLDELKTLIDALTDITDSEREELEKTYAKVSAKREKVLNLIGGGRLKFESLEEFNESIDYLRESLDKLEIELDNPSNEDDQVVLAIEMSIILDDLNTALITEEAKGPEVKLSDEDVLRIRGKQQLLGAKLQRLKGKI